MNILFLVSSLGFGGAERQTIFDANLLSGTQNVFLGYFNDGYLIELVDANVKLIRIKKTGYLKTAFRILKFVRSNNIQLIHANLFASMVISSIASIASPVNVIWHFHSHEFNIPKRSRFAYYFLAKLPNVKKILFVSHELLEYFKPYKFSVIKTGVLYNHSELSSNDQKKKHNDNDVINIGYLGRVVTLKRIIYILELTSFLIERSLRQFKIHIVGGGEELERLMELSKTNGLNEYVKFYGYQTNIEKFYEIFDFFINPSSEECLSIAMIDAGIMSLPIVAFNVGGNSEIVMDKKTGYIVNSKEEFFTSCLTLLENNDLRFDMGLNGSEHCKLYFGKEKHLIDILNVYKDIVKF